MLRRLAVVAGIALALLAQPTACYPIHDTSEGFPRVQCIDGTRWYQDLDGSANRDAGTWIRELPPVRP